jgi:hypothetical protein
MRTRKEGWNTFSNYDTVQFYLDSTKKTKIDSIQLTFGGYGTCSSEELRMSINKYKHDLKQFFYRKSFDGYFKRRFIFIDGFHENFEAKGAGIVFNQVFFYLEEKYYRQFIVDYFKNIFVEMNDYHKGSKYFNFMKYKWRKKDRLDTHQDNIGI